MYKLFIKPFLFLFQPEKAHYLTFWVLKALFVIPGMKALFSAMYRPKNAKPVNVFGLTFPNQVGLAAGFDKDAKFLHEFSTIGFGFIEIGTVTPKPQDGNPKPRLFRLPKDEAIINRMGFNNEGVDAAVERIKAFRKTHPHFIIGGNIGKNKVTPNENAVDDYIYCFEKLFEVVNYFVVNVSSPNTPGLRELQDKAPLTALLSKLQELNKAKPNPKPILLKIAPDLTQEQLDDIIEIVGTTQIAGLIATNTTISREGLTTSKTVVEAIGNGGLSGKPVTSKSTQVIEYINQKSNGSISIIGVGGIHSKQDVEAKIKAGASLVQLYTGFIYEGPSLVKRCAN